MPYLFAYGTLQDPTVQLQQFSKRFMMTPDVLHGYTKVSFKLNGRSYFRAEKAPNSSLSGNVLHIEDSDLPTFDSYETSAYQRAIVELASGKKAWVYCKPE